jgi:ABC-2 type transport system permease protein
VSALRLLRQAFLLQLAITKRSAGHGLTPIIVLLLSMILLSLAVHAHRPTAVVNAVLAPGLIGLWAASLHLAGEILVNDRWAGRLELLIATRMPVALVIFGRILMLAPLGMLAFIESWLIAALGFRHVVTIANPGVFLVGVAVTCLAMTGTASMLAIIFAISRAAQTFQNSISYPIYILAGVMVPVTILPGWLQPVSRFVFLSWSADLLRSAVRGDVAEWPSQVGAIAGLGGAAFIVSIYLTRKIIDLARQGATVGYA